TWEAEVRALFLEWDRKEKEVVALWEKTRQWSLDELFQLFAQLGAPIEVYFYESAVEEPGRAIVRNLLERGIAEVSDGLPVVKIDEKLGLAKETYRTLPILRSDGTTLYATKDLALAAVKFDEYHVDDSIYVVDARQSFYFQQVFKILELMGFARAARCRHLPYEFLTLPEGTMSSRSGNAIFFEDVAAEALNRARAAVDEKNPDLPEETKAEIARAVGIGALLYGMLDRDNNTVIVFDWEQALSFDGHAAPYIQYAHARACRILERAQAEGIAPPDATAAIHLSAPVAEEMALLEQIGTFPAEVRRAAETDKPLIISNYVYELAKRFSDFYGACPVMQAEPATRTARLALVDATRQTLANALALLGIHAPTVM
ncbi:MAG: arginine--tRNA ligase, partial [Thermomicrobiales bacterium]